MNLYGPNPAARSRSRERHESALRGSPRFRSRASLENRIAPYTALAVGWGPGSEPAYLFEDRQTPGDWHVQWTVDEGGFEMAIFSGPRARERAIIFAERCYGSYEQVRYNQG